ncbi:dienelactone hydrolase family protein [Mycobacterium sp. 2YAF39]|uniref:dienelactone hydrolase family protein n=1 Tax=Mycobacterium sp. 2YAF39 TaxID=3233033 RepID=UPI003F9AEC27
MGISNGARGGVLILPGGKPSDMSASRSWQLANQRMNWLALSLRRRLGSSATVRRVQYRKRGWNSPALDALRDAQAALQTLMRDINSGQVVLVGHSMGGRVAVHLAAHNDVAGIVALAPWWPHNDADLVPPGSRLLTLHGTADSWTDPRASQTQTRRAADRGVDARWVGIPNAGHYLLRDFDTWHRLTTEFVAEQLNVSCP